MTPTFWTFWILGTLVQVFGFLLAQVPGSSFSFDGYVLSTALAMLVVCIFSARRASQILHAGRDKPKSTLMSLQKVQVVMIIATIQSLLCLYWIIDLVFYERTH